MEVPLYCILKQIGPNAYLLDFLEEIPTMTVFIVAELFNYHGELSIVDAIEFLPLTDVE